MQKLSEDMKQTVMDIFEHLHANPEVSWKEYETTAFLKQKLEDLGAGLALFQTAPGLSAKSVQARRL